MLSSVCFMGKRKVTPYANNELNSSSTAKRQKMQVSNAAKGVACIKIEQFVKHDVWDIRRKDDGAFVMKKLAENDSGATANTGTENANAGTNPEQTGARPKVTFQVPKTNSPITLNASNKSQNVTHVQKYNAVAANPVNAPKMGVTVPKRDIITVTPANTQKNSVITINTAPAPPKEVITVNTTSLKKAILGVNTATAPKKEVMTINATLSPKKEVITINTTPLVKPTVFTINNTNKDKGAVGSQVKDNVSMTNSIWNVPKEENKGLIASTSSSGGESASRGKPDSDAQPSSTPVYPEEVYRIQEMFPQIQLSIISDNLKTSGSMEGAVDSLLAQTFEEPVPPSEVPPTAPKDDVFMKSIEPDKPKTDNASGAKKNGSLIKIELLANNEIWDIKRKDKEGFVLKKLAEGDKSEPPCRMPENNVKKVTEDAFDLFLDDAFSDGISPLGISEQSDAPVKLMVYSQSSNNISPVTEREVTIPSADEKLDSAMEIDDFDDSCSTPDETVSVKAFEFSEDENEEGETVEHFLFKASLVLKKLRYRNQSEIQAPKDFALLNITGSIKNEETGDNVVAAEVCPNDDDDDDDYYTDECYTDEGD